MRRLVSRYSDAVEAALGMHQHDLKFMITRRSDGLGM